MPYGRPTRAPLSHAPTCHVPQSLCSVCAVDLDIVRQAAQRLDPPPRVVDTNPQNLHDVIADVARLGAELGPEAEGTGAEAAAALQGRVDAAVAAAKRLAEARNGAGAPPPRVVFIEWVAPLFPGGHWTPQMIEMAGGCCPINPPTRWGLGRRKTKDGECGCLTGTNLCRSTGLGATARTCCTFNAHVRRASTPAYLPCCCCSCCCCVLVLAARGHPSDAAHCSTRAGPAAAHCPPPRCRTRVWWRRTPTWSSWRRAAWTWTPRGERCRSSWRTRTGGGSP